MTREKGIFKPSLVAVDFDMDGTNEYLYQGQEMNAYVHRAGGMLFELDYIKGAWNYLDTLSRHLESYHNPESTPVDRYSRRAFIDHFFLPNENINSFDRMTYTELGNFIWKPYRVDAFDRERNELRLVGNGRILFKAKQQPFEVRKRYSFKKTGITVSYTLFNTASIPLSLSFGSETNIALFGDSPEVGRISVVERDAKKETQTDIGLAKTIVDKASELLVEDLKHEVGISFSSSIPFRLWSLPIVTTSRSFVGEAKSYQSSCLVPQWSIDLQPGERWEVALSLGLVK